MTNHYAVLDLPEDASFEQIRAQFRRLVRIFHPDSFRDEVDKQFAERKLRDINIAYNALLENLKFREAQKQSHNRAADTHKWPRKQSVRNTTSNHEQYTKNDPRQLYLVMSVLLLTLGGILFRMIMLLG
ncbi:J domain-containing protein [Chloroflexi bacterium TSY]|nr:J domain-containing protein [Chloroflexi bacterium TSY]